ncbi:hypothetical protein AGMMS49959_06190 [Planctomycetales bacterium]|nr:hypothetical protein AGMMS49959_06190 [Planctomycetales bacterium]
MFAPLAPARFYALVADSLSNHCGEDFLAAVVHRPANDRARFAEISRFQQRFAARAGDEDTIRAALTAIAAAAQRDAAQITAVLNAFADNVCGAAPVCRSCELQKHCAFHNAPRQNVKPLNLNERLAQRLDLADEEFLALLLGGDKPREKDWAAARQLKEHFGELREIFTAGFYEFSRLQKISAGAATRLAAVSSLLQKLAAARAVLRPPMRAAADFYHFYRDFFRAQKEENFLVVTLNQKNAVLSDDLVIKGALTQFMLTPREVFARAIRDNAVAVAFLHNHPSGDSAPSAADRATTATLAAAAKILHLRVLDHLIIGDDNYFSFAEQGLL